MSRVQNIELRSACNLVKRHSHNAADSESLDDYKASA